MVSSAPWRARHALDCVVLGETNLISEGSPAAPVTRYEEAAN
jgi:hypothetical protein